MQIGAIVALVVSVAALAAVVGVYGPDWFGGQPTLHMHNVYVDNVVGSNQRGDGSIANPWQTVQFGIDTVSNYYWTPPSETDQYTVHHPPGTRTENVTMRSWVFTMCDAPSRQCQCICCNYTVENSLWYTNGPGQGAFTGMFSEFFNDSIELGCTGSLRFIMPDDAIGQHIIFHNGIIIASNTTYKSNSKMGLNIQAFDSPYHTKPFVNGSSFKLYGTTSQLFLGAEFHTYGKTTVDLEGIVTPAGKPTAPPVVYNINCDQAKNFQMTVGSVNWASALFNVVGKCAPFLGGPYPGPSHRIVNSADGNTFPGVDITDSISYSPPAGHVWTSPSTLAGVLNDTQRLRGDKLAPTFAVVGASSGSIKSGLCTYDLNGNIVHVVFTGTVSAGGLVVNGTNLVVTISNPVTVNPAIQTIVEPAVGSEIASIAYMSGLNIVGVTTVTSTTSVSSNFAYSTAGLVIPANTQFNIQYYYSLA